MKKVLLAVALMASMAMVSCGPSASDMINKINACTTHEQLMEVYSDPEAIKDRLKLSTDDQVAVYEAYKAKAMEFGHQAMMESAAEWNNKMKEATEDFDF